MMVFLVMIVLVGWLVGELFSGLFDMVSKVFVFRCVSRFGCRCMVVDLFELIMFSEIGFLLGGISYSLVE